MRFEEIASSTAVNFWHALALIDDLRIHKTALNGGRIGQTTIGRVGRSILEMSPSSVENEDENTFNHEMGHVFGLLHEHQRYNRGRHVVVSRRGSDYDVVGRRNRYWFAFWSWYQTNSTIYSTPYDYHSVMHYSGITLRSTDAGWVVNEDNKSVWGTVNGNTYFTPWDIYTIRRLYSISPNRRPSYNSHAGVTIAKTSC